MTAVPTTGIKRVPLMGLMKLDATEADLDAVLRAIEANEPPLAIRRYFRKFQHAVEVYAKVREYQFAELDRETICCDCQAVEGTKVVELWWSSVFPELSVWTILAVFLAVITHFHTILDRDPIGFSSYHRFCPSCWIRYKRYRLAKMSIEALTLLMILVGLVFATWFGLTPVIGDHLTEHAKQQLYVESAGFAAIAIAGIVIRILCRQLGVPSQLRSIAPRPFRLARTYAMQPITLPGPETKVVHVPKYRPLNPSAMSWQQTVGVLITLFGLLPGIAMAFGGKDFRALHFYGYEIIAGWIVSVVILTVWHQWRQKQIREAYYAAMAQQMA